jgi:hypothetical protein
MIKFFRKIRQELLTQNKVSKYLLYAIGEIILVVIGILIALQINNQNDFRKSQAKELQYLKNIKEDLINNTRVVEHFIDQRAQYVVFANSIIEHLEGKPITDWHTFNEQCISIYDWQRYYQINYTFEELTYSGNLGLITNDSIKSTLLNLESLYKQTKAEEDHFRFDSEELIYKPLYNLMDLHPILKKHMGENVVLTPELYGDFFTDKRVKNGFLMVILEFSKMNGQLEEIKALSEQLIATIDEEMNKIKT